MTTARDEFGRKMHLGPRGHVGGGGTLNIGDGSTAKKLDGILGAIAFGFGLTLLGLQEGSDRVKLLARLVDLLRHPAAVVKRLLERRRERREIRQRLAVMGWRVWQPRLVPGAAAVPILYDAKVWRLRRGRSVVAVGRMFVGAAGAGPSWAKARVANVVVVEHRDTGEIVEHLNTHMLPSAERSNIPDAEKARRRRNYRLHVEKLARMVKRAERRGHGVLVTCDANATRTSSLLDPLRDVGLRGFTVVDTHDTGRGIDHVLTLEGGLLVGAPAQVKFLQGFDHRLVVRQLYVKAAA